MLYRDYLKDKYQSACRLEIAEGVPCVLEYSKGKNMRNYEVYGNSVQDGTPTPESPVEIQSVGDLTTKNLLDSSVTISTINGVTMTYDNGVITLNGTCTASANFVLNNIVLSAGTYTLSANANKVPVNNDYAFVQLYDSTNNQIIEVVNSNAQGYRTITTSVDGNFKYRVRIDVGCVYDNVILKPQLEEGSTATEYEPYHKYDIPITVTGTRSETTHIYLDEPLRKVGDYADYIDFKNQKVVRNILKQSLSAAMVYKRLDSVVRILCRNTSMSQKYDTHMLSTIFNYNYAWLANTECIFHYNATHYNYYWSIYWSRLGLTYDGTNVYRTDDIEQTSLTDSEIVSIANEWLSTLSDKDKEIYMILDMPTEENISLPALKTFKGTSIISVDTSVQPSNIKAKYVRL